MLKEVYEDQEYFGCTCVKQFKNKMCKQLKIMAGGVTYLTACLLTTLIIDRLLTSFYFLCQTILNY